MMTVAASILMATQVQGSIYTGPNNGSWNNAANWSAGVPNGPTDVAEFPASAFPYSIALEDGIKLGTLVLQHDQSLTVNPSSDAVGILNAHNEPVNIIGGGAGPTVLNFIITHCGVNDDRNLAASLTLNRFVDGDGDPYNLAGAGNVALNGGFDGIINVTGSGVMSINGAANVYDINTVNLIAASSLQLGSGVAFDVRALTVDGQSYARGSYDFGLGTITVVPEPTSLLLVFVGGLLALARRNRRRA
jgi:hypothetical protein